MKKKKAVPCRIVLLIGATMETGQAAEPYDNVAMPPGAYLSDYPLFSHSTRLMDKNGDAIAAVPGLELYQNTFNYTYYDKTLLPNTLSLCAMMAVGYVNLLGGHDGGSGDLAR